MTIHGPATQIHPVLADACAAADPEVHRVLVEAVVPRRATVVSISARAADRAETEGSVA